MPSLQVGETGSEPYNFVGSQSWESKPTRWNAAHTEVKTDSLTQGNFCKVDDTPSWWSRYAQSRVSLLFTHTESTALYAHTMKLLLDLKLRYFSTFRGCPLPTVDTKSQHPRLFLPTGHSGGADCMTTDKAKVAQQIERELHMLVVCHMQGQHKDTWRVNAVNFTYHCIERRTGKRRESK